MNCVTVFIDNIIYNIKIRIPRNSCHMLLILVFQSSDKSFCKNRFFFLMWWMHFNVVFSQEFFEKIILKFPTLIDPYFIWDYVLNALVTVTPPSSFKGTTHAYLLNKVIAHNKYLIFMFARLKLPAYQLNQHPKCCL